MGPGQAPMPVGSMRRYHVTPNSNLASVRKHGLQLSSAKGIEGPRAVYSWPGLSDAHNYASSESSIVEFHHNPEFYDINPYATDRSVPPENIVAVHEPWHDAYNKVKSGVVPIKNLVRAAKADQRYARALSELQAEGFPGASS